MIDDEWWGILWIIAMCYAVLRGIPIYKSANNILKPSNRFQEYIDAYHSVISFTTHKDVSAETVRFWDSEARRLSDEIGGNTNYDEMILELEQDLNNNFDTDWWKE